MANGQRRLVPALPAALHGFPVPVGMRPGPRSPPPLSASSRHLPAKSVLHTPLAFQVFTSWRRPHAIPARSPGSWTFPAHHPFLRRLTSLISPPRALMHFLGSPRRHQRVVCWMLVSVFPPAVDSPQEGERGGVQPPSKDRPTGDKQQMPLAQTRGYKAHSLPPIKCSMQTGGPQFCKSGIEEPFHDLP